MMKTSKSFLTTIWSIIFLTMTIFCLGTFLFLPTEKVNAADFTSAVASNKNFSMTLTANARKNIALPLDLRQVETIVGEKIDYYCFNWRDLESLRFRFNSFIQDSKYTFKSYKFLLTYVEDDNLSTPFGTKDPEILYQGNISSNTFSSFDFYYYIDSDSSINETATRSKGKDYGLYKFDFVYTYEEDGVDVSVSIGDICVAVLPDDIDDINPSSDPNLRLQYSVSSSNKLMNVFNLYLSSDIYNYVKSSYIQWTAVGFDKSNHGYILTSQMREDNPAYANYTSLYDAKEPSELVGRSFIFDSQDIEGTWSITCTIYNSDGTEKQSLTINDLSTIKQESPSYVWLILLIIGSILLIGGIITFIVLYKKKDKVW